ARVVARGVERDAVRERRPGVHVDQSAVEALVAVDDLEVLAGPGAEYVERDRPSCAARVDIDDSVLLAVTGQVDELDFRIDEAALLERDLDRVRDLRRGEQLRAEQLLHRRLRGRGTGRGSAGEHERQERSGEYEQVL